MFSYEHLVS